MRKQQRLARPKTPTSAIKSPNSSTVQNYKSNESQNTDSELAFPVTFRKQMNNDLAGIDTKEIYDKIVTEFTK